MMKATVKLIFFLMLIMVTIPLVTLLHVCKWQRAKQCYVQYFYRIASWGWRITVEVEGEMASDRPLMLLSNHCSYLDIPVLGQLGPLRFTPKSEIGAWPVIGFLSHLADCVFIDRRRSKTKENQRQIANAFALEGVLSIFPEGTTNDGSAVGEFRSSYLSLAEEEIAGKYLAVQSVMISYYNADGTALSRDEMDKVAWYGDAEFASHLWQYFGTSGVRAQVVFHAPVTINNFADRKELTKHCAKVIQESYALAQKKAPRRALSNNGG